MQETEAKAAEEAPVQAAPEDVAGALKRAQVRTEFVRRCRVGLAKRALIYGKAAKFAGFERISPYYENAELDFFFFAGFDGKSWEEAVKGMPQ